jgi:hypothetical protein
VLPVRWVQQVVLVPLGLLVLRYVVRPFGKAMAWVAAIVARPLVWVLRWLGRGLAALGRGLAALGRWLGRGLVALGRGLAVLWRTVVWPLLVVFGRLLAASWHLAGVVLFHLLVRPVRFLWRALVRPALRAVRRAWRATVVPMARWTRAHVWEPARVTARSVSRSIGLDTRRP